MNSDSIRVVYALLILALLPFLSACKKDEEKKPSENGLRLEANCENCIIGEIGYLITSNGKIKSEWGANPYDQSTFKKVLTETLGASDTISYGASVKLPLPAKYKLTITLFKDKETLRTYFIDDGATGLAFDYP